MNEKLKSENFVKEKSHFLNLFSLAISDNQVDPDEMKLLYDVGLKKGFSQEEIDFLLSNPHKVKVNIPTDPIEISAQLIDLAKMILADAKVEIREIVTFKSFCSEVGFDKVKTEKILEYIIEGLKKDISLKTLQEQIIELIKGI